MNQVVAKEQELSRGNGESVEADARVRQEPSALGQARNPAWATWVWRLLSLFWFSSCSSACKLAGFGEEEGQGGCNNQLALR